MQVIYNIYSGKLVETLDKLVKEVKDRIKGSSDKNTIRQYIRWFNYLLLDTKQGLVQGFYRGIPPYI